MITDADRNELEKLARLLDACAEDAKRPELLAGYTDTVRMPDFRTVCLANGLIAIAAAIRALGQEGKRWR